MPETPIARYADFALLLASTSTPFEPGSLEVGNDKKTEDLKSGMALNIALQQIIGKKPFVKFTLLDPSLVTAWTKFGSGQTITSLTAIFQAYAADAGFAASYLSFALSKGIIVPVQLTGSVDKKATLDCIAHGLFATGTGFTVGTASGATAAITKAYYPTNIIIGANTIVALKSINVNWQYGLQDDDQLEPTYYYYDLATMRGTAVVKDLAMVTAARLEDGSSETVTALFTDANNGANTITVSLGTCKIHASIKGGDATIDFTKIG
jgi:hypothetical protein